VDYVRCPRCKNDVPVTYLFCPYCGLDFRFIVREKLLATLTVKDRLNRIHYLLRHPIIAVKHIAAAPDSLGPLLVLALCSAALFLKNLVIYMIHLKASSLSIGVMLTIFLMSLVLQSVIWISVAILFHITILIIGGRGTFGTTFSILGYTMIFIGFGHLFSLLLTLAAGVSSPLNPLPAYSYAPFLIITAFLSGYGYSYTHLLRKVTSISAVLTATAVFIMFLYIL